MTESIPIPNTLTILLRTNIPDSPVLLYNTNMSNTSTSTTGTNNQQYVLFEPRIELDSDKIPIVGNDGKILLSKTQQQFFNIGEFNALINRMGVVTNSKKEALLAAVSQKYIQTNIKKTIGIILRTFKDKKTKQSTDNTVITVNNKKYTIDSVYYRPDTWVVRPKTGTTDKKLAEKQFELLQTIDPRLVNGPS